MTIPLRSVDDIKAMRYVGSIAYRALEHTKKYALVGVSTLKLNDICQEFIEKEGGRCACIGYHNYPKALCTSVNDVVCHGIPSEKEILQKGDIMNMDVVVEYDGWYGDTSIMVAMEGVSRPHYDLMMHTKEARDLAIDMLRPGIPLHTVGCFIERYAHEKGYSVVEDYCGHGIGRHMHEDPCVLHFAHTHPRIILQEGMCFTIEPMLNKGKKYTSLDEDGWTVRTKDGSMSAQWEHTVAITASGASILTTI